MENPADRLRNILEEDVSIVPYDPAWPGLFVEEKKHLRRLLPRELLLRIEHFGSTAVPGLPAKPVIDILVGVRSLEETRQKIVPILVAEGYEYFWRPTWGDHVPPFYAWFIKRNALGLRTHHIHMVEMDFEHWERLLFRDYLVEYPEIAKEYQVLKSRLAGEHPGDRVAYTAGKTDFIVRMTERAKEYYRRARRSE